MHNYSRTNLIVRQEELRANPTAAVERIVSAAGLSRSPAEARQVCIDVCVESGSVEEGGGREAGKGVVCSGRIAVGS